MCFVICFFFNFFFVSKGYGHVVPYSDTGKMVTVAVILPTIALAMASYVYAGQIITSVNHATVRYLRHKLSNMENDTEEDTDKNFALQTLAFQMALTVLTWLSVSCTDNVVNGSR